MFRESITRRGRSRFRLRQGNKIILICSKGLLRERSLKEGSSKGENIRERGTCF